MFCLSLRFHGNRRSQATALCGIGLYAQGSRSSSGFVAGPVAERGVRGLAVLTSTHSVMAQRALSRPKNRLSFRSSSRILPLKLST